MNPFKPICSEKAVFNIRHEAPYESSYAKKSTGNSNPHLSYIPLDTCTGSQQVDTHEFKIIIIHHVPALQGKEKKGILNSPRSISASLFLRKRVKHPSNSVVEDSVTGNRTRACWPRASYPDRQTMTDVDSKLDMMQWCLDWPLIRARRDTRKKITQNMMHEMR